MAILILDTAIPQTAPVMLIALMKAPKATIPQATTPQATTALTNTLNATQEAAPVDTTTAEVYIIDIKP